MNKNIIINGIVGVILLLSLYFNVCLFELLCEKTIEVQKIENHVKQTVLGDSISGKNKVAKFDNHVHADE